MKLATLLYIIDKKENLICLGMKKRGFGEFKWNGFGGKLKDNETLEDAVIRETIEETSGKDNKKIKINKKDLNKVAILDFKFPHKPEWDQQVHVYFLYKWSGDISESDEMKPKWHKISKLPYTKMWDDDILWLPKVLNGEKIRASFIFNIDNKVSNSNIIFSPL